jgi:hypothetical protein
MCSNFRTFGELPSIYFTYLTGLDSWDPVKSHQPPEVNYIEVFENSDLPQDVYSQSKHPVKKTILKSGSIVHFWWLVEAHATQRTTEGYRE